MKDEKYGDFYLLPQTNKYDDEFGIQKSIVCNLTKLQWRLGNSVLIACDNKEQAEEIDKDLWQFDLNSFLPHSLFKSNLCSDTPIIIYWDQCCYDRIRRDILINLMKKQEESLFINFNKIIDFVSSKSILKECARIRYKSYRRCGFNLRVIDEWKL